MPRLLFDDLLQVYKSTSFSDTDEEGEIYICNAGILSTLTLIEDQEQIGEDANIAILDDRSSIVLGRTIRARIGSPRVGLGFLVRNLDGLLSAPGARVEEPKNYYIIDGSIDSAASPPPPAIVRYRETLEFVKLLSESSSYLDFIRQELVYFRDRKIVIPIDYRESDLAIAADGDLGELLDLFSDELHREQKLEILSSAVCQVVEHISTRERFKYIINNLDFLVNEVRNGYKMFVSSFSYAKIRSDIEAVRIEYSGKIHKTLTDIQGQLLGIPVGTIIIATQLKTSLDCGVTFWANLGIIVGAWIFVALLLISIVNQNYTLSAIEGDVKRQKRRLRADFESIADQFDDTFRSLSSRINWHRAALIFVAIIGLAGALFATFAYSRLSVFPIRTCLEDIKGQRLPPVGDAAAPHEQSQAMPSTADVQ